MKPSLKLQNCRLISILAVLLAAISLSACKTGQPNRLPEYPTQALTGQTDAFDSLEEAADAWGAALADDPSDPLANYQLGLILSISAPDEAEPLFEAAQTNDPSLIPQIERITDALEIGKLSENPAYRLTLLGQALGAIQEWQLARSALQLATEYDPSYAEAWAYLGEAQKQTGDDGYNALKTALSLDEKSYAANLLMALYWRRNDEPTVALDHLLVVEQQDPNNLLLKEDIGNTYAEAGLVEEGINYLQDTAAAFPERSLAWQILARLCLNYDVKVTQVSLPAARQAVLLAEDDPTAHLLLGRVYFQTGNTSMAERFFSEASMLEPNAAEPHYYLGLVYLNQGNSTAAEAHLSQAHQLAPSEGIGLQALQTLEKYFNHAK